MVVRETTPFSFDVRGRRKPSHLSLAVGFSIAVHVAIGLYVAMLQFTGPPPAAFEPERVFEVPWIDKVQPPPPPPKEEIQKPNRPPPPIVRETAQVDRTLVDPLPFPKVEDLTRPTGPVGFDPGPTTADPPARPDPIIRNPSWVKRPDAGDFARFYPDRAMRMERQGEAEITCDVLASGRLTGCRITGETPKNFGFGEAALKLSRFLQIAPKTIDGRPVDGGVLIVPISFRLPA